MPASSASLRWPVPVVTTCMWALAAASLAYWGLRLGAPRESGTPATVVPSAIVVDPSAVAKGLGAVSPALTPVPEASHRFALWGIVAEGTQHGAALIAVDGQSARPYRIGQTIIQGYVLQSLSSRVATLGANAQGPASLLLQLPERAPGAPRIASGGPGGDSGSVTLPAPAQ